MTEDEAKTKWCPFVRMAKANGSQVAHGQTVFNRLDTGEYEHAFPDVATCIGSACMAWRWIEDADFQSRASYAFKRDGSRLDPDRGHCGLAGKP